MEIFPFSYSFLSVNVMDIICCVLLVIVRHQYDVIGHEAR